MIRCRMEPAAGHGFPATRWTLIVSARKGSPARRAALDELLRLYWRPLYLFARRKGDDADAAQDAVQEFIAHILERDLIDRADPQRGRFRSYLRTAFSNYRVNQRERASAQKRGGGAAVVPLDFDVAENALGERPLSAEAAFDREWALGVMSRALEELRREFESGARGGPFEVVTRFFQSETAPAYAEVAAEHGMSIPQLKAFLHRARVRFRELVRQVVADTVAEPADVENEIADLLRALSP
jgi:RNA polymerase sigma-70 factor (ECF subfamily)